MYCQKVCGDENFSIDEWNKAYKHCEQGGIAGIERDRILHPEKYPCTTQCFDCMAIVGETRINRKSKMEKTNEGNANRIQSAYDEYWDKVKEVVDEKGWAYNNELPHLIDYYFETNTGKTTQYQKRYEGRWRGCRWRPTELSDLT